MTKRLLTVLGSVVIVVGLYFAINAIVGGTLGIGGISDKKERETAIEEAETSVKSYVYKNLGVVPDKLKSEVIYQNSDHEVLVSVVATASVDSFDMTYSYCVYVSNGYVLNYTYKYGTDYNYKEHLEELKALFAIK